MPEDGPSVEPGEREDSSPPPSWFVVLRDLVETFRRLINTGRGWFRPAGFATRTSTADLARDALDKLPESAAADVRNTAATGEEPATGTQPAVAPEPGTVDATAVAARELYLRQMEEASRNQEMSIELDAKAIRTSESQVHNALLAAGIVTVALAAVGVLLVLAGYVPVGVVSAAVAILPGVGTVILMRQSSKLTERRRELTDLRGENLRVLAAIQAILIIPDAIDRNRQIGAFAADLARRAMTTSGRRSGGRE
jgi:hypothetical protein